MNTLLKIKEVAEILSVSYQTIRRLIGDPIDPLTYKRIGRSIRFEYKDVLAYKHFKKKYTELNESQRCEVRDYNE